MSRRTGGRLAPEQPQIRLIVRSHELPTRAPLKEAALQMDSGEPGLKGPKPSRWFFDGPPQMRPVPKHVPRVINLTGEVWGRLTVIGLLDKPRERCSGKSNNKGSWVVRCSCGTYETRSAKAIRLKNNPDEGCTQCNYAWHLQRQAFFDRHGEWPEDHPPLRPKRKEKP